MNNRHSVAHQTMTIVTSDNPLQQPKDNLRSSNLSRIWALSVGHVDLFNQFWLCRRGRKLLFSHGELFENGQIKEEVEEREKKP